MTGVLVLLVLAGGVCPALYGEMLPHTHLFVGGPPPANWEHHEHPNPLVEIFGPPPGAPSAPPDVGLADPAASGPPPPSRLAPGRVISLYPGADPSIVSVLDFAVIVPAALHVAGLALGIPLRRPASRLLPQVAEGPAPPPPRFSA